MTAKSMQSCLQSATKGRTKDLEWSNTIVTQLETRKLVYCSYREDVIWQMTNGYYHTLCQGKYQINKLNYAETR